MKKTLALLLCLAMLVTALSVNVFAATAPSITVVTHETTASGDITFAVKLADFDSLKGIDLTIKGDEGVEFTSASALGAKDAQTGELTYTISEDKHTLHIVELEPAEGGVASDIITVAAHVDEVAESHKITVVADDTELANASAELITEYTITDGKVAPYVEIAPETVEEETTVAQPEDNTFIPFGSVYTGDASDPSYVKKNIDGSFNVTAGTTVKRFPIPNNNFGTFGVSSTVAGVQPAKQFGNYAGNYNEANKYGTLVIVGEWAGFRDWYLTNKAYSDADLLKLIYNAYMNANPDGDYSFVSFKTNGGSVKVYNVEQNNWMWKNETTLEYAVRVFGLLEGAEYAAAAYCDDGTDTILSSEVKAVTHTVQ